MASLRAFNQNLFRLANVGIFVSVLWTAKFWNKSEKLKKKKCFKVFEHVSQCHTVNNYDLYEIANNSILPNCECNFIVIVIHSSNNKYKLSAQIISKQ